MSTLWPLSPNWKDRVRVTYEFRTEILTSRAGKEQRRALRNRPRKTLGFAAAARETRLLTAKRVLTGRENRDLVAPDYGRQATSASAMAIGATVMALAEAPEWAVADVDVILVSGQTMAQRTIASVAGLNVTFSAASAELWPAGTNVYPALPVRLGEETGFRSLTLGSATGTLDLAVVPAQPPFDDEGEVDGLGTLQGREIFSWKPNWAESVDTRYLLPRETSDVGFGADAVAWPIDFNSRVHQGVYVGRTRAQADALRQFFLRMKGQRGEFYLPTGQSDIAPALDLVEGAATMTVAGVESAAAWSADATFSAIQVRMKSGDEVARKIESIGTSGGNTVLTFTWTWPFDMAVADIARVSWMPLCRFASDQAVFEWITDDCCQVQFAFRTLEDLDTEESYTESSEWLLSTYGWDFLSTELIDPLNYAVHELYPTAD